MAKADLKQKLDGLGDSLVSGFQTLVDFNGDA